jgi:hypothetical protein
MIATLQRVRQRRYATKRNAADQGRVFIWQYRKFRLNRRIMVPRKGLEPSRLAALPPEGSASTNSATWARAA